MLTMAITLLTMTLLMMAMTLTGMLVLYDFPA
jgi:hypothetical protein